MIAGRLTVLVARFVLFVYDDDAKIDYRREDGRPGTDCHPAVSSSQETPGIRPFTVG